MHAYPAIWEMLIYIYIYIYIQQNWIAMLYLYYTLYIYICVQCMYMWAYYDVCVWFNNGFNPDPKRQILDLLPLTQINSTLWFFGKKSPDPQSSHKHWVCDISVMSPCWPSKMSKRPLRRPSHHRCNYYKATIRHAWYVHTTSTDAIAWC